MASVGLSHRIGYGSDPVIVVVIVGGMVGLLIWATPDGLKVQWNSIHTHFLGLSCPPLLCKRSCISEGCFVLVWLAL